MAAGEAWRPAVGHPRYEVSADGRVRNAGRGRVMTPAGRPPSVNLSSGLGGGSRIVTLKRLVFEAWVNGGRPVPRSAVIANLDGDPGNCRAGNLALVSEVAPADGGGEWRPVVGFPLYEVSADGRVRVAATGRVLKRGLIESGAERVPSVCLAAAGPGGRAPYRRAILRRVVFEAWVNGGRPAGGRVWLVNLDGDVGNCAASNVAAMPEGERSAIRSEASAKGARTKAARAAALAAADPGPTDGRRNVAPSGFPSAWDRVERYDGVRRRSALAERLETDERARRCDSCRWYRARSAGWGSCARGPRECTTTPGARCAAWRQDDGKETER